MHAHLGPSAPGGRWAQRRQGPPPSTPAETERMPAARQSWWSTQAICRRVGPQGLGWAGRGSQPAAAQARPACWRLNDPLNSHSRMQVDAHPRSVRLPASGPQKSERQRRGPRRCGASIGVGKEDRDLGGGIRGCSGTPAAVAPCCAPLAGARCRWYAQAGELVIMLMGRGCPCAVVARQSSCAASVTSVVVGHVQHASGRDPTCGTLTAAAPLHHAPDWR